MREAAVFANAALRQVLEVIDRRRPPTALRALLTPTLTDSVLSVARATPSPEPRYSSNREGASVLRRIRLQLVGQNNTYPAAEVFGTYSRGQRIHAIACRVEQLPAANGARWLVVALHLG